MRRPRAAAASRQRVGAGESARGRYGGKSQNAVWRGRRINRRPFARTTLLSARPASSSILNFSRGRHALPADVRRDRRLRHRPRSISQIAPAAHQRGELILGGALANPADGAVLVFEGDSPKAAEDFAKADPYVVNGLITRWKVREWTTVVGDNASVKVDPNSCSAKG